MRRWREYDAERDADAVVRIWREVGWIEGGNDDQAEAVRLFAKEYRSIVADLNGEPECYVATGSGTLRYVDTDLPISMVSAVTTSHIARRQGLAGELTAASVARDAAGGAMVSALGMFDQGYYDRLGFGTGAYEIWRAFDPGTLDVPANARPPIRLGKDDWERIHASRHARIRRHGAVNIDAPVATHSDLLWESNGFGFGYADGPEGELTHHLWIHGKGMEHGPWTIWWMAYQTPEQFLELMALLQSLGDQVHLVRMREPAGIQIQDFIRSPFKRHRISQKTEFEAMARAAAYWQMRICDLEGCIAAVRHTGEPLRFNLRVEDPVATLLPDDAEWRGVGGAYVVELGEESVAEAGRDPDLPTLEVSVGALTRMWLGVLPATGLAVTDRLAGPPELLEALDRVFRLPPPRPDWDF